MMNLKDIQELIKFVAKSGATEVDLEFDNVKISIKSPPKKRRGEKEELTAVLQETSVKALESAHIPKTSVPPSTSTEEKSVDNSDNDTSSHITIKSSMIGTFYRSSGPDKDPYVNVGDLIKPGNVICIIEAMKLFNEIESEVSGKIVKVLVDDNSP
ncbi:uncharacterized protein METZ01_LOCUS368103, partial [marine metagenome]